MKKSQRLIYIAFIVAFSLNSCSKDNDLTNQIAQQQQAVEEIEENSPGAQENNPGTENSSSYQFDEPQVIGNTFYLDPVNGSIGGDGSEANPWSSLQEVLENNFIETYKHEESNDHSSPLVIINKGAAVKGGDRLILKDGYHGQLEITNFIFDDWLTIEGASGEKPTLARLHLNGLIKNVYFKNLNIIKESYQGTEPYWQAADLQRNNNSIIYVGSSSFFGKAGDVKINGCTVKTSENVANWSRQDWEDKFANGIYLRASENVEVVNSTFENVGFGIIVDYFANNSTMVDSTIKNFCRDGVRLTAHDFHFEGNRVEGLVNINTSSDNAINFHYDAFQAFSRDENDPNAGTGNGVIRNAVIRGNIFIGESDLPLDGSFLVNQDVQGIGCFDGFFDHFIIENNIVSVSHHHGITLLGATNTTLANNTVIDSDPTDDLYPWIRIGNHKNGSLSQNGSIVNNIATQGVHVEGDNVLENNNHIIGSGNQNDIYNLFVDPDNYDFHLLNNPDVDQHIIDAGTMIDNLHSSMVDKDGKARIASPDLGAYERVD